MEESQHQDKENEDMVYMLKVKNIYYLYNNFHKNHLS